jgi:hypothetical protein
VVLLVFAIVPQTLVKAPALNADLAYWFGFNFILAALADWIMRHLLPDMISDNPPMSAPLVSPLIASLALLLAVVMTAVIQLPAPGAIMVGVIIVLRSDGDSAAQIMSDRLIAALVGGAIALGVWQVIWWTPNLLNLALALLLATWILARRIASGGPDVGLAMKSLSVLAILIGEGFSVFYEDADDRLGTRLAGVMIGLLYVSAVIFSVRYWTLPSTDSPAPAPPSARLTTREGIT